MTRLDFRLQTSDIRKVFFYCSLWSVVCSLTTGCVERTLTIRSEPEGATLLLNDKPLGTTPYSGTFEWYGSYRVTLDKDGYHRLADRAFVRSPAYLWIPLDLVMELMPFTVQDQQVFTYRLVPKEPLWEPSPPIIEIPGDEASTPASP